MRKQPFIRHFSKKEEAPMEAHDCIQIYDDDQSFEPDCELVDCWLMKDSSTSPFGKDDNARQNVILVGQTHSGKTTILQNMLRKCVIPKGVKPENIIIFSKTAMHDFCYKPIILWMMENTDPSTQLHIYENIDFDIIQGVKDKQGKKQIVNMSKPKRE